jgi:ribosomal protein S18 acetylase RimI-like enzyme
MEKIEINNGKDYLVWRQGSGETIEIFDIAVFSKRGVGAGTKMLQMLVDTVRGNTSLIWAMTRESNQNAHLFYEKRGFKLLAKLEGFYGDESAYFYALKI